jgi:hypothetical protein
MLARGQNGGTGDEVSEPKLELGKFFRKVRDDLLNETGNRQRPFEYGSLTGEDLFFRP